MSPCKRERDSRTSFLETSRRDPFTFDHSCRRHRFIDLITSQLDASYMADRRIKAFET